MNNWHKCIFTNKNKFHQSNKTWHAVCIYCHMYLPSKMYMYKITTTINACKGFIYLLLYCAKIEMCEFSIFGQVTSKYFVTFIFFVRSHYRQSFPLRSIWYTEFDISTIFASFVLAHYLWYRWSITDILYMLISWNMNSLNLFCPKWCISWK